MRIWDSSRSAAQLRTSVHGLPDTGPTNSRHFISASTIRLQVFLVYLRLLFANTHRSAVVVGGVAFGSMDIPFPGLWMTTHLRGIASRRGTSMLSELPSSKDAASPNKTRPLPDT